MRTAGAEERKGWEETAAEAGFGKLAAMPRMGRRWRSEDPRIDAIRAGPIPGWKYLVLYRPTGAGIDVIRVLHTTKDTFVTTALHAGAKPAWLERQTGVRYETLRRHYGRWMAGEVVPLPAALRFPRPARRGEGGRWKRDSTPTWQQAPRV